MSRAAVLQAPYQTRGPTPAGVLLLDRNEGPAPARRTRRALAAPDGDAIRRYPDAGFLEQVIANRFGIDRSRVLATAGADDAIDRCCRAFLTPGREIVHPRPTFLMLERYAALAGGTAVTVPWTDDRFPLDAVVRSLGSLTSLVALVSPNNPTGAALDAATLRHIAGATQAMVLLDHAYVEYADFDLTSAALTLPNVIAARTLSKAWGLAGCRVGYALGSPEAIATLRAAGGPYPVAAPSLLLAGATLRDGESGMLRHVRRVRSERRRLTAALRRSGIAVVPSQASFVLASFGDRARSVYHGLLERGILVRDFVTTAGIEGSLRISLPGGPRDFARLLVALQEVLP